MLSIDAASLDPLWDSVNTYFPVMLGIFAIGGGIGIAVVFGRGIVNTIATAIKSALGSGS